MNELIKVDYSTDRPTVLARDLHEFLEVETPYHKWFPRMCEYGFSEGQDYTILVGQKCPTNNPKNPWTTITDAQLTIDMAKEICMLQRNEKGKQARQYFIQLEKDWNSPEKVMARALRIADEKIKLLSAQNSELTVQNTIMQPKAEYFDELVDRNLNTGIRETAKELGVKEKDFVRFLLDKKYLYRDKKGKLQPYAQFTDDLFVLKECFNEKTSWSGTQLLITPKGRETFRLLFLQIA